METQAGQSDPYEIVLADLRAQRAQIDQTIMLLERIHSVGPRSEAALPTEPRATPIATVSLNSPKQPFHRLTIVDAAKKLLESERREMTNAEMVDLLKAGGLVLNSPEPANTVSSVLNRRFQQIGDVVRVGRGTWGLKEWYLDMTPSSAPAENSAYTQGSGLNPTAEALAKAAWANVEARRSLSVALNGYPAPHDGEQDVEEVIE